MNKFPTMRVVISGTRFRNVLMTAALLCVIVLYMRSMTVEYRAPPLELTAKDTYKSVLAPCGEVCKYTAHLVSDADHSVYPQIKKHFECMNIMRRMAFSNHNIEYPPPRNPPEHLLDEFTQNGDMPIQGDRYFVHFKPTTAQFAYNRTFTPEKIRNLTTRVERGENINCYNDSRCMIDILDKYKLQFRGGHGVVIGSQSPWLESILVTHGARHVTTLEYSTTFFDHPKMSVYNPYEFAENYISGKTEQYDFAATFSSLEHSGLGRYGDPINPYGDLEAMAQIWCMMKPGGVLLVGVPGAFTNTSYIEWNANRVYGPKRLSQFAANWRLEEYKRCRDPHIILVLTKRDV